MSERPRSEGVQSDSITHLPPEIQDILFKLVFSGNIHNPSPSTYTRTMTIENQTLLQAHKEQIPTKIWDGLVNKYPQLQ
jgi:hypothetical protein